MIKLHHLNDSRSQKIAWLFEELALPYEIVAHQRDPVTLMGPPALKALHPIGKAPTIDEDGRLLIESGAIVDYVLRRYGQGRLQPDPDSADLLPYTEWLYFAVSAGMNPIMIKVYARAFGQAGQPMDVAATAELDRVLRYIDAGIARGPFLLGTLFTAADIQLSFVPELAASMGSMAAYPNIVPWRARLHARPAFRRSVEAGVSYRFAE